MRGTQSIIEMNERKILFKKRGQSKYFTYIDIGACEKHPDFLPLYEKSKTSYINWYQDFRLHPIGEQILTLHYYLLEFNSQSKLPKELNYRIAKNIDSLNEFNHKWFEPSAPIFNSLDLNWEDIENEVLKAKKNNEGIWTEIEFKDGSSIRFLDDDDQIRSFYVTEKEFEELKTKFNSVLNKLK